MAEQTARVVRLSPSTDAMIVDRGAVVLIRGDRVFRLTDREARSLTKAVAAVLPPKTVETAD